MPSHHCRRVSGTCAVRCYVPQSLLTSWERWLSPRTHTIYEKTLTNKGIFLTSVRCDGLPFLSLAFLRAEGRFHLGRIIPVDVAMTMGNPFCCNAPRPCSILQRTSGWSHVHGKACDRCQSALHLGGLVSPSKVNEPCCFFNSDGVSLRWIAEGRSLQHYAKRNNQTGFLCHPTVEDLSEVMKFSLCFRHKVTKLSSASVVLVLFRCLLVYYINVQAMLYLITYGRVSCSLGKERVMSQYVRFAEKWHFDKSEGKRLGWTFDLHLFNQSFL